MDTIVQIIAELKMEMDEAIRNGKIPPPPDFDEEAYLQQNPDVAEAVRAGSLSSGFAHYFQQGHREGRSRPARHAGKL